MGDNKANLEIFLPRLSLGTLEMLFFLSKKTCVEKGLSKPNR